MLIIHLMSVFSFLFLEQLSKDLSYLTKFAFGQTAGLLSLTQSQALQQDQLNYFIRKAITKLGLRETPAMQCTKTFLPSNKCLDINSTHSSKYFEIFSVLSSSALIILCSEIMSFGYLILDSLATVKTAQIQLVTIKCLLEAPTALPKKSFPILLWPNFSVIIGVICGDQIPKSIQIDIFVAQ
ncbi:hypothetical protein TTHERM_000532739 (macronuclear) [Tetrahymena thermophila SB210]|uniref:Transmembrane protein n=1 Tax=Tetrahymena thermophila (strain SB210) TaxID=312017 RepID=W7XDK1_TETTS|nr:hypothetical protein TTHERM_000532739 [Tetrahymena thermophila SB210]EWS71921.1 hypothetical protein TTHERM_000532739 [Tetrahymena thermophila SB210]|eukprot:XP_012655550.1 hypothetical protein TTHERM_000532739 [Tetrahymena thermophila SB210]